MNRLNPADLPAFLRKYRFAGGKLRRLQVRQGKSGTLAVELVLSVRTALRDLGSDPRPARLRLRLDGVEEYRFQKRPGTPGARIPEAHFGYFEGLVFANLDAWSLDPGEAPKIHDYRASDAYAAGRELWWEEIGRIEE